MPIIKSAKKRVKVAAKASIRNAKTKRQMRESIKSFTKAIASGSAKEVTEAQKAAFSAIDTAIKKDVIHKNKGSRKKAQLAAQAKATGTKVAAKAKPTAKKTAAKSTAKKTPAKTTIKTKTPAKKTTK